MTMIQRLKNKKGFTLVELIVVIVIIAILAVVAVPMLTKYISNANASARIAAEDVVSTASQAAAAAVIGGIAGANNTFKEELDELLPEKYTVGNATSAQIIVTLTGSKGKIVTITGTGLDAGNPVITKVVGSGW